MRRGWRGGGSALSTHDACRSVPYLTEGKDAPIAEPLSIEGNRIASSIVEEVTA